MQDAASSSRRTMFGHETMDGEQGDEGIALYKDEMTDRECTATMRRDELRSPAKSKPYKSGRTQFAPHK